MEGAVLTLPVGHLIDKANYSLVPGIKALEYKKTGEIFGRKLVFLYHCNYGIVQNEFIEYFDGISGFLKDNKFRFFSFDLGPAVASVTAAPNRPYVAQSADLGKERLKKIISRRLDYVRSKFTGRVGFENLNFFPNSAYVHVCEPDFISEVIRDNDAYLVLDLAHALISAQNMRMDIRDYLLALPLERVIEVHVSGPRMEGTGLIDAHEPPGSGDYKILKFVREILAQEFYLTVEYYSDFSAIQKIYRRLTKGA